ncbi:hypothetical protein SLVCU148_1475 [Staphylococcus lugdunensis VCU148]|nr:hypothetical protein SLGD_00011 [Staphylococcus lugdunensis HKU09-01]KAK62143.1 hypothetical protein SLVCU148_1475 [Staphylococcus lugdunensis VCU148]
MHDDITTNDELIQREFEKAQALKGRPTGSLKYVCAHHNSSAI